MWRSGIEATISEYDRKTGVKHLRVRGLKAVRFCAILKAAALNIFRAAAVKKARNNGATAQDGVLPALKAVICAVKEHFAFWWHHLKKVLTLSCISYPHTSLSEV
ncbi:MAG: hypothetical protein DRG71_09125 [Deltaproteobacteria bacterium]|nr:MAG: hypothetical protein DRG71_09125 [Deltaproteobacteria bacterium]